VLLPPRESTRMFDYHEREGKGLEHGTRKQRAYKNLDCPLDEL